mmetsp:Transcript_89066/g.238486  ORF Transcript_89066/g.238486 Transcript_89066/m.238486 type:complete len:260 (-) Transcript_89066:357-1136(-)
MPRLSKARKTPSTACGWSRRTADTESGSSARRLSARTQAARERRSAGGSCRRGLPSSKWQLWLLECGRTLWHPTAPLLTVRRAQTLARRWRDWQDKVASVLCEKSSKKSWTESARSCESSCRRMRRRLKTGAEPRNAFKGSWRLSVRSTKRSELSCTNGRPPKRSGTISGVTGSCGSGCYSTPSRPRRRRRGAGCGAVGSMTGSVKRPVAGRTRSGGANRRRPNSSRGLRQRYGRVLLSWRRSDGGKPNSASAPGPQGV